MKNWQGEATRRQLGERGNEVEKQTEQEAEMGETKTKEMEGEMVVAWWNGGGKLIPRLNANPGLQKYISVRPDVFVYGEA